LPKEIVADNKLKDKEIVADHVFDLLKSQNYQWAKQLLTSILLSKLERDFNLKDIFILLDKRVNTLSNLIFRAEAHRVDFDNLTTSLHEILSTEALDVEYVKIPLFARIAYSFNRLKQDMISFCEERGVEIIKKMLERELAPIT